MVDDEVITLAEDSNGEDGNLFSGLPSETLVELSPAKSRMILLYITGQYNLPKIAQIVGVSVHTVRAWLMQESVQTVVKELQHREFQIIDSSLKALRMKALNTIDNLMDSPMDAVRFQASKDILDRTGHKPINEMKVNKTVMTIERQLSELADVAIDDAEIIDITDIIEQVKHGE